MESPPIVICNTTPVINFAEIGRMDVLERLFGKIVLPSAVTEELRDKAGRFPLASAAWNAAPFRVQKVKGSALLRSLAATLHRGEAECLALALGHPGPLLILDDVAARETALTNGCDVTGTLGCLLEAKKAGIVAEVSPLIEQLRDRARFWISKALERAVLGRAEE